MPSHTGCTLLSASCHSIIVTPLLLLTLLTQDTEKDTGWLRKSFMYIRLEEASGGNIPVMLRGGMIQQRTRRVIVIESSCHKGWLLTPCIRHFYWQMKFYPAQRAGPAAPLPSRYNWLEKCCVIFSYRFIEPSRLREHFPSFWALCRPNKFNTGK